MEGDGPPHGKETTMSDLFGRGVAAAAHLVIQGDPEDFNNIWLWSWKHYGEEVLMGAWSDGFYTALRAAGYQLVGAGQMVPESD